MTSTFTDMAIQAFRAQEQARRRLWKAEQRSLEAARLVPADEKPEWFSATEQIRMDFDAKQERDQRDAQHAPSRIRRY